MTDLRKQAKNKPCQIRLPGCRQDVTYTVLCHVRLAGVTGGGMKSPDLLGAWGCDHCHILTEREKASDYVQRSFLEAVIRTQALLIEEGLVHW